MPTYQEQFDRVKRYHKRFADLDTGFTMTMPSENYIDDTYAFFQNCYHLKDWLINDPAFAKKTKKEIEDYITATPSLALCADICNGTKHLVLLSPRSGSVPSFAGRVFRINMGGDQGTVAIQFAIDHNGAKRDAFDVATECVRAWEAFLK